MPDLRDASSADRSERPGEAMLEVERLSKTFNPASPNEVRALQGVSLTIASPKATTS